jgi:small-conductance mechanosensitive channel
VKSKIVRGLAIAVTGIVCLAWPRICCAQDADVSAVEPTVAPTPAIPVSEMTARSQEAQSRLEEISDDAASAATEDIVAELDDFADVLPERMLVIEETQLEMLRQTRREELKLEWHGYGEKLNGWEKRLLDISATFEADRLELDEMRKLWQRTLAEAEEQEAPDALVGRVQALLEDIDATHVQASVVRDGALTALDLVADIRVEVDRVVNEFVAADRGVWARALTIDGPPLWAALRPEAPSAAPAAEMEGVFSGGSWARVERFVDRASDRMTLVVVLLVCLSGVLLVARRQLARDQIDDTIRPRTAAVAERPFAGALLTMALLSAWLLPGMPPLASEIVLVVVLASWLRLIPVAAPAPLRPGFYAIALLFLADHYGRLLVEGQPWSRVALLMVSMAGAGIGVWALRRDSSLRDTTPSSWERLFRALVPVATLLLVAASAANLVGAVSLAQVVTRGTVSSAALATVLFLAVLTVGSMVLLVTRGSRPWLLRTIRDNALRMEGWILAAINLGAVLLWADATLALFGARDVVVSWLRASITRQWTVGDATFSLAKALTLIGVFVGTLVVSRIVRELLEHDVFPRLELPRGVPNAVSTLIRYAFVAIALLLAPLAAGVEFSNLAFIAGGLGVGIGFGLQNIVANFVSGLILAFERPIQVGDTVEAAGNLGHVKSIGVRSSTIRRFDGAEVVVPNSNMVSDVVLNWTLSDFQRRMQLDLVVAYGADPHRVLEILREAAERHDDVHADPPPMALFRGFTDTGLAFRLLFWIRTAHALTAPSEVGLAVFDALEAGGFEMPIPRQRVDLSDRDGR